MRAENRTHLKLGILPQRKISLGVPLTEEGDILLGSFSEQAPRKSRIVISRKEDSLYVCRKDGEPIQIGRVFSVDRYEGLAASLGPVMGLRRVLKRPLAALVLHADGDHKWTFHDELHDPENGPDDLRKFFDKIANVSLKKQRSKKI